MSTPGPTASGGPVARAAAWARPAFTGLDRGSAAVAVGASVGLLLSRFHGRSADWRGWVGSALDGWPLSSVYDYLYWYVSSALFYGLVPLLFLLAVREPVRAYGVGAGDWRTGLKVAGLLYLVMLPAVAVVARLPAFAGAYPLDSDALQSWGHFFAYEAGYAAYFVSWEWLFRGVLLFGMHRRIGNHAIWVQLLPFVVLHAGKPEAEAFGSIVAGIALAVLALRTRSFWYGALLHAAVAFTLDLLVAWGRIP